MVTVENVTHLDERLSKPTVRAVKDTRAYTAFRIINGTLLVIIAGVTLYLVGRGGAYVNGNVVVTDGGRLGVFPGTY